MEDSDPGRRDDEDGLDVNNDGRTTLQETDDFYNYWPSLPNRTGIVYYGDQDRPLQRDWLVRHVVRTDGGNGSGCSASSKLREYWLIAHDVFEMDGGRYGSILKWR